MRPGGMLPTSVELTIPPWDRQVVVYATAAAFSPPGYPADIGVLRFDGQHEAEYTASVPPARSALAILGFSIDAQGAEAVASMGSRVSSWLRLSNYGARGMSGGPVVGLADDGRATGRVHGVYVGSRNINGQTSPAAFAVTSPEVIACKDAVRNLNSA